MNEVAHDRLMTIADLSTMLGSAGRHLYGWRHRGEGGLGWERILLRTFPRARPLGRL
jgi:hypothetical protein